MMLEWASTLESRARQPALCFQSTAALSGVAKKRENQYLTGSYHNPETHERGLEELTLLAKVNLGSYLCFLTHSTSSGFLARVGSPCLFVVFVF